MNGVVVISEKRGVLRKPWLWDHGGSNGRRRACADSLECPRGCGMLLSQSPSPDPALRDTG